MVVQTGLTTMSVSWTAPSVIPGDGYRITINSSSTSAYVHTSPHIITISTPGAHTIRVVSLSQHLPGGMVERQGVIMKGKETCTNIQLI